MERYRFVYEILSCRTWRGASPCSQRASGQLLDGGSKRGMTREKRKRVNESACLLNENADRDSFGSRYCRLLSRTPLTPKRRQNEAESSAGAFSRCYV